MTSSSEGLGAAHRRLLWRCRRGMKELDLLLSRFARQRYAAAPLRRRREFEQLLELPDPQLAAWLLGQARPPPEWQDLIQAILDREQDLPARGQAVLDREPPGG